MSLILTLVLVVQVLSALTIIGLVLLQHGKGADAGAAFGGGSAGSLFGAAGAANFLSRTTKWAAIIFFVSTGVMAYLSHSTSPTAAPVGVMEEYEEIDPSIPQVPGLFNEDASIPAPMSTDNVEAPDSNAASAAIDPAASTASPSAAGNDTANDAPQEPSSGNADLAPAGTTNADGGANQPESPAQSDPTEERSGPAAETPAELPAATNTEPAAPAVKPDAGTENTAPDSNGQAEAPAIDAARETVPTVSDTNAQDSAETTGARSAETTSEADRGADANAQTSGAESVDSAQTEGGNESVPFSETDSRE